MNRTRLHLTLALTLLLLATVVSPLLAAAPRQGETRPTCGVQLGDAAQMMNLLMPAPSPAAKTPPDFSLRLIGQCCINNDATRCPVVAGYSTVHCAFPMCGAGILSCVYQ
jgi:hypothetical protein